VIEVERTVNPSGNVSLGNYMMNAGLPLAGQRITLRLDGPVAHILSGGTLVRTIACPVPQEARSRLRGGTHRNSPVQPGITITAPRTASRDIKRHKASNYQPG
jgi:hypothetical protein